MIRRAMLAALLLAPLPAGAQEWAEVTQSRRVVGERSFSAVVDFGAGRLVIRPADPGLLYRIDARYDPAVATPRVREEPDRIRVDLAPGERRVLGVRRGTSLTLALSRTVPTALDLTFGAAEAEIELGGIPLTGLRVSTGASDTELSIASLNPARIARARFEMGAASFKAVGLGNLNADRIDVTGGVGDLKLDFGGAWPRNGEVRVEMGVGSLAMTFPRTVGVQISKRGFLLPLQSSGLERRGDVWVSPGFDQASRQVNVTVDGAVGSVDVRWGP